MPHSFSYSFDDEAGTTAPRFTCALCHEFITDIASGTLAYPVALDDQKNDEESANDEVEPWANAVILHLEQCMDAWEDKHRVRLANERLDDAIVYTAYNCLNEAGIRSTEVFLAKLKRLTKAVEAKVVAQGGDINFRFPWE